MVTINSIDALIAVLSSSKNKGQFASIEGETPIKLNKFPTDGSEKIHIAEGFAPTNHFIVRFHFDADYERAMANALGVESYSANGANRRHIVRSLLMEYISTKNVCAIYMPKHYTLLGRHLNGRDLTSEEIAYMKHYQPKASANIVEYRTIGVKNIKRITFGGQTYIINIE